MAEYLVKPDPEDARLTATVAGRDQTGARVETSVGVERPLTLYLNDQEIVTLMTVGDHPKFLAAGYLINQNMLPDVAEITTACWDLLGVHPSDMMCASSRMVVRRKGAAGPAVLACTLLPYDARFELGATLAEAARPVKLNHPHCARFCVLGGGSCSAA